MKFDKRTLRHLANHSRNRVVRALALHLLDEMK